MKKACVLLVGSACFSCQTEDSRLREAQQPGAQLNILATNLDKWEALSSNKAFDPADSFQEKPLTQMSFVHHEGRPQRKPLRSCNHLVLTVDLIRWIWLRLR